MSGNLYTLPTGQVAVDGSAQLLDTRCERVNFVREVCLACFDGPHLVKLLLKLNDRFFEVQQKFIGFIRHPWHWRGRDQQVQGATVPKPVPAGRVWR